MYLIQKIAQKNYSKGKVQASISKQSLSIGLSKTVPFTFTLVWRTKPFLSVKTSTTLPRGHELRGEFSTLTRTISPTARFLRIVFYFCLLWSRGKYSLDHRFQKISARYCTCFHLRREKESSFWNNPGGIWGSERKRSKWFGVRGSGSLESLETVVIGRPFMILSTSHKRVSKPPSSTVWFWSKTWRILRIVRMQHSQTPP